jgi:ParB family chromosome partitioning protein
MASRRPTNVRLGRGLNSLLSSSPTSAVEGEQFFACEIGLIDPMPGQPRRRFEPDALRELSESIAQSGVLQPLVVRESAAGRYTLIAGERRLRASKLAGLERVPVVLREVTDREAFALALVENLQREDLNPIEEALAYQRLIDDFGATQEEVGQQLGKGRSTVTNALRLLKLNTVVQGLIAEGALSPGHARAVLAAPDAHQAPLAERIITEGWSVRKAEQAARAAKDGEDPLGPSKPSPPERPPRSAQLQHVERSLMEHFGVRVRILQRADKSGTIELSFADHDGLQAILDRVWEP